MTVGKVGLPPWLMLAYTNVQFVLSYALVSGLDQRTTSPPRALSNSFNVSVVVVTWYGRPLRSVRLVLQPGVPTVSQTLVRLIRTDKLVLVRPVFVCFTGLPIAAVTVTTPGAR